ncbi:hypothetical protein OSB04_030159 [Centaurea solstitialis]|uniref:Uncharacterized protein n=1 Tax=Centaurea solstitialis TaxID=347529 RepID=A0AA38W6V5_9ASTR|nr:hypothetical protein OSB04_030159 [Centaurea solstitialis]
MNLKMAPKRGLFPLLLIISLSALFIFSLHRYSTTQFPTTTTNSNQIQNPNFSLTIKLLTYDRLPSLRRCLRSLAAARYDGDHNVNLHVFIDHFKVALDRKEEDADEYLVRKLNESRAILEFVDGFEWKFGEKMVHYRTGNVGLQAQWLEAWWPASDDEFAFVVEDDIEVSPLYYGFLKGLIVNYYYNASNYSPWIYGASLQRPRFVPAYKFNQLMMSGKHGNKIHLDKGTQVFLYQLVGTWGQLLFPRPWKEFRLWYDTHKTKDVKPILDGMVTTGWYKKMGDKIWTPWFIKFIHARGYFNIYTNFLHETALSVSHRDAGVNYGKTAGPDSNLMQENSHESNHFKLEPLRDLKWYDFCFREVVPDRMVTSVHELEPLLQSVRKMNSLVLVSIYQTSETFTRNLLCHFERLGIRNYIFIGPGSDFLLDLSRRGHPVIDVDRFLDGIKEYKSIKYGKENFVKAFVIKKALEMNCDTWVLDHNALPVKTDLFLDSFVVDSNVDFYIGKRLGLFFAKGSSSGVWTDRFVNEIARMADTKTSKDGSGFVFLVEKMLEMKGVKFQRVDEGGFGVEINDNGKSLKNETRVAFWSTDLGSGLIRERLVSLGLWIIDDESNCRAVICHPS